MLSTGAFRVRIFTFRKRLYLVFKEEMVVAKFLFPYKATILKGQQSGIESQNGYDIVGTMYRDNNNRCFRCVLIIQYLIGTKLE